MNRILTSKGRRWTAGTLAVLVLAWTGAQIIPPLGAVPGRNPFRAQPASRPLVIAHAGGLGLHPENTLEAFTASAALGCDMFELDVRLTKDGVLVTHHDATVERTSNGKGAVSDQTVAELKALNFGFSFRDASGAEAYRERPARLATLEELFARFGSVPMIIELKDTGETGRRASATLAALINKCRLTNQVLVASFDDATLDAFRQATGPGVATSTAAGQTLRFVLLNLLRLDRLWPGGAVTLQVPSDPRKAKGFKLAQPSFIQAAHARNMAVHYWTVNEADEMRRLIRLGADGLVTDYPDRLQAILAEHSR